MPALSPTRLRDPAHLAAIENTLRKVMEADPAFAQRALTRNPGRPSLFQLNTWNVQVFELRQLVPLGGLIPRPRAISSAGGLKRNVTMFRAALVESGGRRRGSA